MGKLTNQVAVVTGASKGIGADISRALAAEGASVVVNYASSQEGADRVVKEITANSGKAVAVQADVSKQADITRLFAETKKAFGKLNILVNNAGTYEFAPLDAITVVLAKELGPRKIRVNSINPGMIETEGVHSAGLNEGDFRKWIEAQSPLGRIGQPNDISPTIVYLASSDSKYLTGEIIRVTGGISEKKSKPRKYFVLVA
jgi:3-oxoacyl-[acyl-carrier protein] reductase